MVTLVGKTVGKYQLKDRLGAGGMAEVYRAIQKPLEREVALKVMHTHLMEQIGFKNRFLQEAKAIAALSHPHIVQIYDYEITGDLSYMAMEFLRGDSLEDHLMALNTDATESQFMDLDEALETVIQVAQALNFAHKRGVIHRDIKPANIMRTAEDRVVLTDFGIATLLHETRLTTDGGATGTPSYMSPEQAMGGRGDERSDIYSLGAVFYQLVTGQLPFQAETLYSLIMMHVNEPPPAASEINAEIPTIVDKIIKKAMAKNPDERYQTADEFAANLKVILARKADPQRLQTIQLELEQSWLKSKLRLSMSWGIVAVTLATVFATAWLFGPMWFGSQTADANDDDIVSLPANPETALASITSDDPETGLEPLVVDELDRQIFSETFTDNSAQWLISEKPIRRQVIDGVYQIDIALPGRAVAAYPKNDNRYDRYVYSVEALLHEGQLESGYGMIFHRQDDENYYVFAVNGLRQWSIWRLEDKVWHELRALPNGVTWTDSKAILPRGQTNRLRLEVDGPTFNLFANGQQLLELTDAQAPFTRGGIGFYAATSRSTDETQLRVQFDNVIVSSANDDTALPSITADNP